MKCRVTDDPSGRVRWVTMPTWMRFTGPDDLPVSEVVMSP